MIPQTPPSPPRIPSLSPRGVDQLAHPLCSVRDAARGWPEAPGGFSRRTLIHDVDSTCSPPAQRIRPHSVARPGPSHVCGCPSSAPRDRPLADVRGAEGACGKVTPGESVYQQRCGAPGGHPPGEAPAIPGPPCACRRPRLEGVSPTGRRCDGPPPNCDRSCLNP